MTKTTVVESHGGKHVRTLEIDDDAIDVVSAYVARGFDVAEVVTGQSVRLVSGNAVVVVTKSV